jgi:hypothetical protein
MTVTFFAAFVPAMRMASLFGSAISGSAKSKSHATTAGF